MPYVPAIHFSHHACNVDNPYSGGGLHQRLDRYFGKTTIEGHRSPARPEIFYRCRALRFTAAVKRTSDRALVTCKRCVRDLAEGANTYPVKDDVWARAQCWLACCRFHGVPSPFDKRFTKKIVARVEQSERRAIADGLKWGFQLDVFSSIARLRENMLKEVEKVPPEFRAALRPAFDELTMAADLADEVSCMLSRAEASVGIVAERIRNGWTGDAIAEGN